MVCFENNSALQRPRRVNGKPEATGLWSHMILIVYYFYASPQATHWAPKQRRLSHTRGVEATFSALNFDFTLLNLFTVFFVHITFGRTGFFETGFFNHHRSGGVIVCVYSCLGNECFIADNCQNLIRKSDNDEVKEQNAGLEFS